MHYYKRNLGDYAKKAGRLSMLQHGSYTLLIDACYDREQFPTLEQALEWTWASTTDEKEAVIFVLHKFFMLEDGVFVQKRIREELIAYHDKSDKNTRIAIDRETKRKETSTKRAPCVNASPPQEHEPPPNHKPLTNNQEPITKEEKQRERRPPPAKPIDQPSDVDSQTWADFLALRTKKRAPVTATVINGAREESAKAGMTLEDFLKIWCRRGSQGMEASWLKPDEIRPGGSQGFNRQEALEARNRAVVARMMEKENQNALG